MMKFSCCCRCFMMFLALFPAVCVAGDDGALLEWQECAVGPRLVARGASQWGAGLEYKQIAGGLGLQAIADGGKLAFQQHVLVGKRRHITHEDGPITSDTVANLGVLNIPGMSPLGVMQGPAGWGGADCLAGFEQAGQEVAVRARVSRLCPGVLIQTDAARLVLFDGAAPAHFAYCTDRGVEVRHFEAPEAKAEMTGFGESWVLCWHGADSRFVSNHSVRPAYGPRPDYDRHGEYYKADTPMLLVFSRPPDAVVATAGAGMAVEFALPGEQSSGGQWSAVMLPLYGEFLPKAADTAAWEQSLPQKVVERCRWWNAHLDAFPLDVRETYAYDAARDRIVISERFTYETLRNDGRGKYAPVPPMVGIAADNGFPLQLPETVDTGVLTSWGPSKAVAGADSYEWSITGLGKYVLERLSVSGTDAAPEPLVKELDRMAADVVGAGHLAPYLALPGKAGGLEWMDHPEWSGPGEGLLHMARYLPLVDEATRAGGLKWMGAERSGYPPESVLQLDYDVGARREFYPLLSPAGFVLQKQEEDRRSFHRVKKMAPLESLAALAAYCEAQGGCPDTDVGSLHAVLLPYLRYSDWASLGTVDWGYKGILAYVGTQFYGKGGVMEANRAFNSLIGYIRLMRMLGDRDGEHMGWGLFGKTAALRFALGKYADYLYASGINELPKRPDIASNMGGPGIGRGGTLYTPEWNSRADDVRQVVAMDEFGTYVMETSTAGDNNFLVPFRELSPELGRFLGDYLKNESEAYIRRVDICSPSWFIKWNTAQFSAEHFEMYIGDSHQIFLARAWVLGEDGLALEKYLDVPWMKLGDFYYMDKLAATIMAFRGVEWK